MQYVALLRGINVSGKNAVKMIDLENLIENIGYFNVSTYKQSGNVIFESNQEIHTFEMEKLLESKMKEHFGLDISVLIRSKKNFAKYLKIKPFQHEYTTDNDKYHITFLKENVVFSPEIFENINFGDDKFCIIDSEIYLYCPNGYGKTKLNNIFFEKKLKTTATTRNWNSVEFLAK